MRILLLNTYYVSFNLDLAFFKLIFQSNLATGLHLLLETTNVSSIRNKEEFIVTI
jgi:hypothetical protein